MILKFHIFLVTAFSLALSLPSTAAKPTTLGNPEAPVTGTFYLNLKSEPESLNPINSTDAFASTVQGYVSDGLFLAARTVPRAFVFLRVFKS